MMLVREVMYCKPGKVRALTDKFLRLSKLMEKAGQGKMTVMTDFSAERFWTVVAEFQTPSLAELEKMFSTMEQSDAADAKEMEDIMKGYHDLVDVGRREIYKIEG
jgi:hypothetical protein